MPKIGLINLLIGFSFIVLSSCYGIFLAEDVKEAFLKDQSYFTSWYFMVVRSAHSHTGSFSMLHILLGLTMPYSLLPHKVKILQTVGLFLGTLGMSLGLLMRALNPPASDALEIIPMVLGFMYFCAFVSIFVHCYGLLRKILR